MKKVIFTAVMSLSLLTSFTKTDEVLTKEVLWKEIKSLNIEHAEIVFAQAILESGHFRSKLFKTNNNLFGMRLPKKRETTAVGKNLGYARYKSWNESVKDYALYQQFVMKRKNYTEVEYFKYLDRVYCESAGYSTKLKKIIKNHKELLEA